MKKKETIIFLAPTPPPFMGPTIATEIILCSRFVRQFHVIHIDTCDRRPLSNLGKLDFMNIYLSLKNYFFLLEKLLTSDGALVYIPIAQTSIGFLRDLPFVFLAKIFRKKVVLHLRGGYFRSFYDKSSQFMRVIIRSVLKNTDRLIVLGNSIKELFKGLISEERISVVPNGLDIEFNNKKDIEANSFIVLYLSNFAETKGYKEVLRSVNKVSQFNNKIKYIFAGSWMNERDKHKFIRFIKEERMERYVHLVEDARKEEKLKLLSYADIFVFPTYYPYEGHPWVIVEAMAAGLPIITTDTGCIKESVVDGENGFIIPPNDSDSIAEKIIYLMKHPEERKRMGLISRKSYENSFTEEHFVQRMIQAINCTLSS